MDDKLQNNNAEGLSMEQVFPAAAKNKDKEVEIYSALQIAKMCGVVNQTTINWIRNGYLKAFNTPGGQYRVYKDELIKFFSSCGIRIPDELLNEEKLAQTDAASNAYDAKRLAADWNAVIVVADDPGLNNMLKKHCIKKLPGVVVYQALDGFDAGVQVTVNKPGFIILDIDLPGIDGKKLCKSLKMNNWLGESPYIIAVTDLQDSEQERETLEAGADCFFKKPLNLTDIFSIILDVKKQKTQ